MAEYEPFPTGANEREDGRRLAKGMIGCVGLGGLGVGATVLAALTLLVILGSVAGGCEFDLGDPGDGTDSERLPVTVTPRTGLADGATVRVTSDAFDADTVVGVAVCLRSADTEDRGAAVCDEDQGARYATDGDGHLDATFPVPRVITVGGQALDCAASPERCLVVAADASDYDRSGGQTLSFQAGLPAAELVASTGRAVSDRLPVGSQPAADQGALPAGSDLTLLASGFEPDEPLLVAYCTADVEALGMLESCEPTDATLAITAIMGRSVDGDFPRSDASGAFTTTLPAQASVLPYGDDIGQALNEFSSTTTTAPGSTTRPDPDRWSCTADTGGCVIVIAAAADTKRSALLPYTVAG